jgi:hypothetical protein
LIHDPNSIVPSDSGITFIVIRIERERVRKIMNNKMNRF